jgi:hypothetical protein
LDTAIYSPTNTQGGSYVFQKFYALLHTPAFFSVFSTSPESKKHTWCQQRGYNFLIIIIRSASKTKTLDPMARNMPVQKPLAVLPNTR